jgi:hypothetical protein
MPTDANAQSCGDPNGNGIDVVDAANVLRAAVALPSACTAAPVTCDVSGQNGVDVIDAANVLRAAVGLPAVLACPDPEVTDFADTVEEIDGTPATLTLGIAPIPQPGAPATISDVDGPTQVQAGGTNTVTVTFDAEGAGATQAANDPGLIIAFQRSDSSFADGFFDLPLDTAAGQVTVVVSYDGALGSEAFNLAFATRVRGVLSDYATLVQVPVTNPVATPTVARTPTPTATPTRTPTATPTPAPDACDDVTTVPPAPPGTIFGSTSGPDTLTGACGGTIQSNGPEQVFRWTPAISGQWEIRTCGSGTTFTSTLYIRVGDCRSGTQLLCNQFFCAAASDPQGGSIIQPTVTAGTTYFVIVDGAFGTSGNFQIDFLPPLN